MENHHSIKMIYLKNEDSPPLLGGHLEVEKMVPSSTLYCGQFSPTAFSTSKGTQDFSLFPPLSEDSPLVIFSSSACAMFEVSYLFSHIQTGPKLHESATQSNKRKTEYEMKNEGIFTWIDPSLKKMNTQVTKAGSLQTEGVISYGYKKHPNTELVISDIRNIQTDPKITPKCNLSSQSTAENYIWKKQMILRSGKKMKTFKPWQEGSRLESPLEP